MSKYVAFIEIEDGKVDAIMQRLEEAKNTIHECYMELESLGVVTIKEKAASGN